ncbi:MULTISPECIES: EF-hand domain-containing protein [unclassified Mesorhizobium]|uniref:EF-hand domain-containing protein n=4 Tax=Mesorhizobium TaxID=68287 RepID=UPI001129BC5E|nr:MULTISPECIES: EF-hand domain-containing protein [unclassified Mesorhizobium]MCA0018812.1 EF-hand domain-containing protein [Mesorhizobium sp. B264B1A]TPJ46083.1 EF-hand domain-containing protein [Mesorhizobium sp. B2-6-6]TPJ58291.1 EF-hand domain-containing protein [Mesorhizobium sp. B2-6-1]TPJ94840.1 EF-hand domain-containing protein [Mesorhizobium sp. B2-5-12]TPK25375.1 EF-hand domain-containing protein [Mesorhizobium sp. B2-5-6]TPK30475.1 EF-hand domain-containing protein [Mesorhizobium
MAQTSGTPDLKLPTQQSGSTPPPGPTGHIDDQTREMMRQMIDEMLQEKLQGDGGPEGGPPHRKGWHRDIAQGPREAGRISRKADRMGPRMMYFARMQIMFAIMDADGDGALSHSEIQDVIGRIFDAVDENGDGRIDLEEIQSFSQGRGGGDMQ